MAFTGIIRPGHIALRVMDLQEALDHYVEGIGLIEVHRREGQAFLKAWDEQDLFSLILIESDRPGIEFLGFKTTSSEDLPELESKLNAQGIQTDTIPAGDLPGCGPRLRFTTPMGHAIEVFAEKDRPGTSVGFTNPAPWPDDLKGMAACSFDHCLLVGPELPATISLFCNILGFQVTERGLDPDGNIMVAFLSCSNKAHDIALTGHPEVGKLHHLAFRVDSWDSVLRAADIVGKRNIPQDLSPTRHGMTRGQTTYFFDPSGNRNEIFTGGSHWHPDHEPITWTAEEIGRGLIYPAGQVHQEFMEVVT